MDEKKGVPLDTQPTACLTTLQGREKTCLQVNSLARHLADPKDAEEILAKPG